jgi:hypothetical protein
MSVDKVVKEYQHAVGAAHNRAGIANTDREVKETKKKEAKHSGPPDDLPKHIRKALGLR